MAAPAPPLSSQKTHATALVLLSSPDLALDIPTTTTAPASIDLISSSRSSFVTMDRHHVETLVENVRAQDHHQLVLRERGRRIKAAAELGLARSSASRGRQWGRALGRRRALVAPPEEEEETSTGKRQAPKEATPLEGRRGDRHEDDDEEEEDEVVVEEKVALLRQLVPGGEGMAVEGLLEETADYIAALKAQVGVMRALTCCLLSGSDLDAALRPESSSAGLLSSRRRSPCDASHGNERHP